MISMCSLVKRGEEPTRQTSPHLAAAMAGMREEVNVKMFEIVVE